MNDPQEPNHWDQLVSQLGATPPPPEQKPPDDKPKPDEKAVEKRGEVDSSRSKPTKAGVPPPPQRAPTDWGRVAEQLGIEPQEAAGEPPPVEAARPCSSEGAGSDFLTAATVAESTRTDLVPAGAEAELPGFPAESAEKREQRVPERKHRRRRQKPKGGGGQPPASESAEEAGGPLAGDAPAIAGDDEEGPEGCGSATQDRRSPERSKRRRRRGSGRRKGAGRDGEPAQSESPDEFAAGGDEAESPQMAGAKGVKREPDKERAKSGGRKDAKSEKASRSAKTAHRGIPNWAEAVGILISANMEARAKKPSTSSRSRGGRGRGGRDRSGDKSK